MRILATLRRALLAASMLSPCAALAQTLGTVNLVGPSTVPGSPQITPAALADAINAALAAKADASGGVLASPSITGSLKLPSWTTAGRPGSPVAGMIGWNTTTLSIDQYNGSIWGGAAGNALALTGGTVTGATTFSAAGSGLTVSNNLVVGGNLTIGGTFAAAGFDNTSSTGYLINGETALFLTPTNIPGFGTASQQGVFVGPSAGKYFRTNNIASRFGMVAIGVSALENLQANGAETVCVGQYSCRLLSTGTYGVTGVGQSVMMSEEYASPLYATGIGNDAMRDTVGNFLSTAGGAESQRDGVGNTNTSWGSLALHGNAGSITVTGTPTSGDVLHITFTTTSGSTTGLPATVAVTVPGTPTNATLATAISTAINGQLTVGFLLPSGNNLNDELGLTNFLTSFTAIPTNVVGLHFPGGTTSGFAVTASIGSCTGTCGEVLTVNPPFSGHDNLADGSSALYGISLGAANFNDARGSAALARLGGASSGIICYGYQCGENALTGSTSVVIGSPNAALNATSITASVIIGANALTANAMNDQVIIGVPNGTESCFGAAQGTVSIGYGDCPISASEDWQLSIQRGAIVGRSNNKGGGGTGGGQIGVEVTTAAAMDATFTVSDYGGAAQYGSHFKIHQTTAPAITGCTGCTLNATGADAKGTVTYGTAQTGFVLTFNKAFPTAPDCQVSSPTGDAFTSYAATTTTLTLATANLTAKKFSYQCTQ